MKRFIFALAMMLSMASTVFASNMQSNDVLRGYTTDCMIWNGSRWQSLDNGAGAGINIEIINNIIYIHSGKEQRFVLYNTSSTHKNKSGHDEITSKATDEDGKICDVRIVFRDDIEAPMQIYFHFSNISYVYNIILTQY